MDIKRKREIREERRELIREYMDEKDLTYHQVKYKLLENANETDHFAGEVGFIFKWLADVVEKGAYERSKDIERAINKNLREAPEFFPIRDLIKGYCFYIDQRFSQLEDEELGSLKERIDFERARESIDKIEE